MSAPQFTPGPWSLGPWIDSMGGHVYRVVSSQGRKVSGVTVYGKRPDGSTGGRALKWGGHTKTVASEECDANANLIVAAPDLYHVLSVLVEVLMDNDDPSEAFAIAKHAGRTALAKARGEP